MIAVSSVWLSQGEGATAECAARKSVFVSGLKQARHVLRTWATTAPVNGGYYKVRFVVTFEDGEQYIGRYDLKNDSTGDIGAQMVAMLAKMSGVRPAWMTEQQHAAWLADVLTPEKRDAAARMLGGYDMRTAP